MKLYSKAFLAVVAIVLAACTNPGRFDQNGFGAGGPGLGDVRDPTSQAYFQQSIGDRVLFEVDQSSLSEQARQILAAQAVWLTSNSEFSALIEGHADEQGTREYNLALGARRAHAVVEFLVSQGVAAGRLQSVTFGKERPIAICSDESCYAQNRRAVTVVAAGGFS